MRKAETLNAVKGWNRSERISRPCRLPQKLLSPFLVLVICLIAGVAKNLPKNDAVLSITAGSTISRELAAGAKELLGIASSPGLLRFSIDKGDLALSVTLYDPAGQKLFEQVSYHFEKLDFSVPAEVSGTYLLEIRSLEINEPDRQYELKIEPTRPITTWDQKNNVAQRAAASASILRADWTEKSLRQAIKNYDEAALILQTLNDLRSAAVATMEAGEVCFALGDYREALMRYKKAATQAKNAGAKLEEFKALSEVGRLYSYLGDNDEAQKHVLEAAMFLVPNGQVNQPGTLDAYAKGLVNLGEISYSKGNFLKSSKQFEDALELFDQIGNRDGAARAHLFMGYIAGGLGDPEKAAAEISQSLRLYRAIGNKSGEGLSLTALGLTHSLNRGEDQAIRMHREASDIFRRIGDRQSEAIAVNGLAQAYENLGEYPTALGNYRLALRLFQDNGSLDFASGTMFHVARAYRLNGDLKQALAYYEKCLNLSRAAKKVRTEANALNDVAVLYATHGNREKTITQYRRILKFYAAISDRRRQAVAWNNLGDFYFRFGEKQKALGSYNQALPLSEQAGDQGVLISSLYNIARAHRDLGALELALPHIERSITIIENLRTNVASPEFRISYFSGVRRHYDLCIDILMQLDRKQPGRGFAAAGLLTSEKARARSLLDILREVRADIRPDAAPEDLQRERELRGLLRAQAQYQMELKISGKDSTEAEEVARQVDQLRTEHQELVTRTRDRSPRFLSLTQPAPLTLEQIQAQLRDGDTILLEYALGDERSYLWAVTGDSFRSYELPSRSILEDEGHEVYKLLTARQAVGEKIDSSYQTNVEASDRMYHDKALNLSQLLFGQVADQLGTKRLVIVTEGMLQYVPVDALPAPPPKTALAAAGNTLPVGAEDLPLLIATHEIVTLPSVSTLMAIRQEKREVTSSDKIVAVLADPVFSKNDDRVQDKAENSSIASSYSGQNSTQFAVRGDALALRGGPMRLVHASEEADAILAATPRGTGLVARGFDASRETAMSSLVGEYKIVHFATHGFLNSEHPELSGIVLTMANQDGSKTNGFMPLRDIYNLNLSADLVVLSACDTGLGKDIKGEGLVGLTHGFLSAGSKSVVASLWKVDDRATAVLMAEFYTSMLEDGLPPAAALRSAKQKIRQEKAWSAPYFWAGFIIQGEYKEPVVVDRNSWLRPGVVIWLAVLLVLFAVTLLVQKRRRRSHLVCR